MTGQWKVSQPASRYCFVVSVSVWRIRYFLVVCWLACSVKSCYWHTELLFCSTLTFCIVAPKFGFPHWNLVFASHPTEMLLSHTGFCPNISSYNVVTMLLSHWNFILFLPPHTEILYCRTEIWFCRSEIWFLPHTEILSSRWNLVFATHWNLIFALKFGFATLTLYRPISCDWNNRELKDSDSHVLLSQRKRSSSHMDSEFVHYDSRSQKRN